MSRTVTLISLVFTIVLTILILTQYLNTISLGILDWREMRQKDGHITASRKLILTKIGDRRCESDKLQTKRVFSPITIYQDPVTLALLARLYAICELRITAAKYQTRSRDISGFHFYSALLRYENVLRDRSVFKNYDSKNDRSVIIFGIKRDGRLLAMLRRVAKRCPICRREFRRLEQEGLKIVMLRNQLNYEGLSTSFNSALIG